jgi:acyl-CoA synthetase (AMP-forming)/AMP-acid ligase II
MHTPMISRAGFMTVGELLSAQARRRPHQVAVAERDRSLDYATLNDRANRLAHVAAGLGLKRGERLAILSENRLEYLEATFAAAKLGVILCCLNWRLAHDELVHCVGLVTPAALIVSERFDGVLATIGWSGPTIRLGSDYEARIAASSSAEPALDAEPEDGLLILYTSGTTGLPKGALISHRAELARMTLSRLDFGLDEDDGFVAWAPLFHMVALEHSIHVLGLGGRVFVVDGADIARIVDLVETERQWWLVLIPGMAEQVVQEIKDRGVRAKGLKLAGALADLFPKPLIAETSRLLGAPYWNTFGSTETGMMPAAGTRFPAGAEPQSLAKAHNSNYLWRLVDAEGKDVARGEPGEMAVRGPTVFSGYWNAGEVNAEEFRDGWFHMGDVFIEQGDGSLQYVDRSKYMIKSGGENIYPAEIERVLMADPRVAEAVVVKRRDAKWGEVPVAFVALQPKQLATTEQLMQWCRSRLSSYKCPREIRLVAAHEFPRSTSGKVQRQAVERWALPPS